MGALGQWIKYDACVNCGNSERPHRARGYCSLCYGPAQQIREVLAWNRSRPETLRRFPGQFIERVAQKEFEATQQSYIEQLQARLDLVRYWESTAEDPADGIDLEFQLNRIAEYAGAENRRLYGGLASYIDWQIPPDQRRVVRELLRRIEKNRPWRGVNLYRVFTRRDDILYGNGASGEA